MAQLTRATIDASMNPALLEHALTLLVRQQGGSQQAGGQAQAEAERWRAADPRHEAAWAQAQGLWQASDARGLREAMPLPATRAPDAAPARRARRRAIGALAFGGLTAALAGGWRWQREQPLLAQVVTTARGQQLSRTLPDGTNLVLAPRTELAVALYRDRRVVALRRGEALFDVAGEPGRPFEVGTPLGIVQVTGTRFSVAYAAEASPPALHVAVSEGRVRVRPRDADPSAAGAHAELAAGQQLRLDETVAAEPAGAWRHRVQPVRAQDVAAWRDGWLVFDAVPLPAVVERWNDYLAEPVTLAPDARLAALRLTGSYLIREPGAFIDGLPAALPVRVQRDGGGWRIEPR